MDNFTRCLRLIGLRDSQIENCCSLCRFLGMPTLRGREAYSPVALQISCDRAGKAKPQAVHHSRLKAVGTPHQAFRSRDLTTRFQVIGFDRRRLRQSASFRFYFTFADEFSSPTVPNHGSRKVGSACFKACAGSNSSPGVNIISTLITVVISLPTRTYLPCRRSVLKGCPQQRQELP